MEAPNGHAHCMSMFLGSAGESIPVGDGELCIGTVAARALHRARPLAPAPLDLQGRRLVSDTLRLVVDRDGRRRRCIRIELEDPELAAHHVHGDVVDRHAVDLALERAVMRVAVNDELRTVLADRACETVCAEHEPQAAPARRRASPRPASSAAARCAPRTARSRPGPARARRHPSSFRRTPRGRAARRSSPTADRSRRRSPSPRNPDAHAVDRKDRVRAIENDDTRLRERTTRDRPDDRTASRGSRARRLPVLQVAARVGDDAHLVDLTVLRQVAREQDQVGLRLDAPERLDHAVALV